MRKKNFATIMFLCIIGVNLILAQGTGKITGTVTDSNGKPLGNVNVLIKNTNRGAATDQNGNYVIAELEPGTYTIVVDFIGYEAAKKEVQVSPNKDVTVNFKMNIKTLKGSEIVVVGYGVQRKSEISGSVSSINVEDVKKISTSNVSSALQGGAAGVNVSATSGAPGSSANIKIRGTGTLTNNNPLYIVDGVPVDNIDNVDVEDVQSIDILKDASAAAIYGSRAANGVVQITTKRGRAGELNIKYHNSTGYQMIPKTFPMLTNSEDYVKVAKESWNNSFEQADGSYGNNPLPNFITDYQNNPNKYPDTEWQDEYFRNIPIQKHYLNVSGGSDNYNFSVSGTYNKQKGIVTTTNNEKMGLRINSDLTKGRFKVGESFSINRWKGKSRGTGGWNSSYSFYQLSRMAPLVPVYDESNESGYGAQSSELGFQKAPNPITKMELDDNEYDNFDIMASGYLDFNILDNLKYTFRISQNISNNYSYSYNPKYFSSAFDQRKKTSMAETRSRDYHTVIDNIINYSLEIDKHSMKTMAGYSRENNDYRTTYGYGETFPNNEIRVLDGASESEDVGGVEYESRLESIFGRLSYNFSDKYFLQGNIRRDGSSRFNEDDRYGIFPSVSAGWRISEEDFFNLPLVNKLKIRGSYGVLGNQEIGDYQYIANISSDNNYLNYPFGPGIDQPIFVGARAINFPSRSIKWETTKSSDLGLDLGLMEGKFQISADYYVKTTSDILYELPIPPSAGGFDNPIINSAEIENRGFELKATFNDYKGNFKYQLTATATTYKNEVNKLGVKETEDITGGTVHWSGTYTTRTIVGEPVGSFYLFETAGIFKSQSEIENYTNNDGELIQPNAQPGDFKFVDINGNGMIDSDDRKFMGSAQPNFEFGLNFNGSYGQFDFNAQLYGITGKKMYNGSKWLTMRMDDGFHGMHEDLKEAWSEDNKGSDIPRLTISDPNNNMRASDFFLEDASYLRLKHIEVGYTLSEQLSNQIGLSSLRIYLAGNNVFTLTGYTGYDPSIDYGTLFSRGVDRSPYPISQEIMAGIQINL